MPKVGLILSSDSSPMLINPPVLSVCDRGSMMTSQWSITAGKTYTANPMLISIAIQTVRYSDAYKIRYMFCRVSIRKSSS